MRKITGEPECFDGSAGAAGYDGAWWKWWLRRDGDETFVVVKVPRHVQVQVAEMPHRTAVAALSHGRTEVERHLLADAPPRVVELSTFREPTTILR